MEHEVKRLQDIDIEEYIKASNDIIIIPIISFQKETNIGHYNCLMLYKQYTKVIEGTITNVQSPNHTMVLGVLETVKHIKISNENVCILSYISLGFKSIKSGKGLYTNEVTQIIDEVIRNGNTISSIAVTDGVKEIKRIFNLNK